MGRIVNFSRGRRGGAASGAQRGRSRLWTGSASPTPRRRRQGRVSRWFLHQFGGLAALAILALVSAWPYVGQATTSLPLLSRSDLVDRHFPLCRSRSTGSCVIDGDTFRLDGQSIRIADINTPEVRKPKCAREAALAGRATLRLQSLLNAGPFEVRSGVRDSDVYGRKLRTTHRGNRSLGMILVAEGLAHEWAGFKQSWCG
jgi:micrococcal nuclease